MRDGMIYIYVFPHKLKKSKFIHILYSVMWTQLASLPVIQPQQHYIDIE